MNINQIYNEDCQEGIKRIPDTSIDCILTDPPYLYLKGQKLDRSFDKRALFLEFARVLKPKGFIVLFGRGTSFYRWNTLLDKVRMYNGEYGYLYEFNGKSFFNDIEVGSEALKAPLFQFKEEIIWNKRRTSSPVLPLARVHETISIHTISGSINKSIINYGEAKAFRLDKITEELKRLGTALNKGPQFHKIVENLKKKNETGTYSDGVGHVGYATSFSSPYFKRHINTYVVESMLNGVREQSIIEENRTHLGQIHPTQKPVRLLERLLALTTQPGDVVLDPFSGSCSTAIACVNTNREYIGFEIDKEYYEAGTKRLNDVLSNPRLAM